MMSFDLQPVLASKIVCLRPLKTSDFEPLYAVAADPLIWEQHPEPARYQEPVFRRFFADAMASCGALLISDTASQRVIGSSRYSGFDPAASEVEIAWMFLARDHWGGTYNAEVKRLMLGHAFRFVERVAFYIGPHSRRSHIAVQRIGAVRVSDRMDATGETRARYEITREAFQGFR